MVPLASPDLEQFCPSCGRYPSRGSGWNTPAVSRWYPWQVNIWNTPATTADNTRGRFHANSKHWFTTSFLPCDARSVKFMSGAAPVVDETMAGSCLEQPQQWMKKPWLVHVWNSHSSEWRNHGWFRSGTATAVNEETMAGSRLVQLQQWMKPWLVHVWNSHISEWRNHGWFRSGTAPAVDGTMSGSGLEQPQQWMKPWLVQVWNSPSSGWRNHSWFTSGTVPAMDETHGRFRSGTVPAMDETHGWFRSGTAPAVDETHGWFRSGTATSVDEETMAGSGLEQPQQWMKPWLVQVWNSSSSGWNPWLVQVWNSHISGWRNHGWFRSGTAPAMDETMAGSGLEQLQQWMKPMAGSGLEQPHQWMKKPWLVQVWNSPSNGWNHGWFRSGTAPAVDETHGWFRSGTAPAVDEETMAGSRLEQPQQWIKKP